MGQFYSIMSQYPPALEAYAQSLEIRRQVGDRAGEAITLNNIASVYSRQNRYAEALTTYQQALAIFREAGYPTGEGHTLQNIGVILAKQQHYIQSLLSLHQAYALFTALALSSGTDSVRSWIDAALAGIRDNNSPTEYQQQCLTTAQATNIPLADLCPD